MKSTVHQLTEQYAQALKEYFANGGEASLLQAYQLGRAALAEGLDVLEMAALHQEALVGALLRMLAPEESARIARRASEFFAESLAPFEMTRRGYQEANAILRGLNKELEERVRAVLEEYKAAQDQLDEHRRMERLKNEFISVVSHELRTPLTSIHGAIGLIRTGMGGEQSEQAQQLLDVAYRNSQRLVRLVSDILDLQKIESGTLAFDLRPLEIASLLEQSIEANQAYAAQLGVSFRLEEAPKGDQVRADADRFMQVMANLLSNAAKFSPRGASVSVAARRAGGAIRVSVTDQGPGIPGEFRDQLFQKFAQADTSTTREKGGTGLGLSISKAIVERMGGRIGFESRTGAGTTFYFDLPGRSGGGRQEPRDRGWRTGQEGHGQDRQEMRDEAEEK